MHKNKESNLNKSCTLYVDGMHCSSCEILIERSVKKLPGVNGVKISKDRNKVEVTYNKQKPDLGELNSEISRFGYYASDRPTEVRSEKLISYNSNGELKINTSKITSYLRISIIAAILLALFIMFERSGLGSSVSVSSSSSIYTFFLFGLVAGASSCAALVGGVLLSLAKQWNEKYIDSTSTLTRSKPYIMFNLSRVLSFGVFGGVLGMLGGYLSISPKVTAGIVFVVSIAMLILGFQMLEFRWAQNIRIGLPKFFANRIFSKENNQNRFAPAMIGALTFFFPCGFTIVAQGLALASGSFINGALIMGTFALGTLPVLVLISLTSVHAGSRPALRANFNKIAGLIVVIFALYNFNAQLNVIGLPSISDLHTSDAQTAEYSDKFSDAVDMQFQVIKMNASALGYSPNYFKVRAGIPVRWEISDIGASGCTNGIIADGIIDGQVNLLPGLNVAEFIPPAPGKYKFSCWMGMATGIIEVV